MSVAVASPLRYSHSIGVLGHGGRGFSNPYDVAIRPDGVMFVLNRSNPTQGPPGGLRVGIVRVDDQEFLGDFGSYGTEDGQFTWLTAIALDSQGTIYVADEFRHDVQVFDRDGTFLRKWGSKGDGPGQFNRPSGLAAAPDDTIYVVDHLNFRVQRLTTAGQPIVAWGSRGNGPGQFELPWGIAVDDQGAVYVADWGNDRVQKLTPEGEHLATFGSSGTADGQFTRPSGVDVVGDGNVYVADWGNNRVQMFGPDGTHLVTLLGDSGLSAWAEEGMKGNLDLVVEREGMDLTPEMRFWGPTNVKVDARGHVVVVDSCRHRLQVYQRVTD
jgi:DNA-binding beta-propeller fold protein YncE